VGKGKGYIGYNKTTNGDAC